MCHQGSLYCFHKQDAFSHVLIRAYTHLHAHTHTHTHNTHTHTTHTHTYSHTHVNARTNTHLVRGLHLPLLKLLQPEAFGEVGVEQAQLHCLSTLHTHAHQGRDDLRLGQQRAEAARQSMENEHVCVCICVCMRVCIL